MNAVDTNILVYARDPRDPRKQETAIQLIETLEDGALLWQVACKYVAAARKLERVGCTVNKAWSDLRRLRQAWNVCTPESTVLDRAKSLMGRYSLSFWDAMLVAACADVGVSRLDSEDFGPYPAIDNVEIVNPFK